MHVSFFPGGSTDRTVYDVECTWDQLPHVVAPGSKVDGTPPGEHLRRPPETKEHTPCWSPVEYRAGSTRGKSNVLRVNAFVIDFDGGSPEQIAALAAHLHVDKDKIPTEEKRRLAEKNIATLTARLQGLAYIAHTSWSHATEKKPIAIRVVVKLSRPIEASEWPKTWRALNAYFADLSDPQTKDASRLFFCAAHPRTVDPATHSLHVVAGEALDVDRVLTAANGGQSTQQDAEILAALGYTASGEEIASGAPLTRDEFVEYAHELARSKSPRKGEIGRRLKKVAGGERFASVGASDSLGGVDNALFRMTSFLAERFFDRDPASIAEIFGPSLALQFREDGEGHDADAVIAKFERRAAEVRTERAETDRQALVARARRIREAFGTERVHGYTPDEMAAHGDMTNKWVIQSGSSFYLFFDGDYRPPVSDKSLIAAAARDLAPAHTAGVEVYAPVLDGEPVPKTPLQLTLEYGAVAHEIVVDITAQRSTFDVRTRTFTEASCPFRVTEGGAYVEAVDRWLTAIGSNELLQWIALASRLDRPCAALYLDGVKGSGKSLLAHGLARLWSTGGPTMAGHAIGGTWNDDLTRCPLVFADETLPPRIRQSGYTGELREFIQAARRPLARRYKPNATMIGAVRLILAANNKSLLETTESLTPNDVNAIAERFLYVKMGDAATRELERIGGRDTIQRIFVEEDGLAKHSLWLAANKKDLPRGRFFFENGSEEIARSLTTQSGIRSSVCSWIVMYLLNPAPIEMLSNQGTESTAPKIAIVDGQCLVSADALVTFWAAYKTNRHPPSPAQAGAALRGLSHEGVTEHAGVTMYRVDDRNLLTWAEETGYCATEQIRRALVGSPAQKRSLG